MDVFDLYAKLSLDSSDYDRSLQNASGSFEQMVTKFTMGAKAIGSVVGSVVRQAVDSYAEYEQLVGGAKKIFDEMDYSVIAADAADAWKTMNLSASEYLSMINNVGASFSATMGDAKGYETAKIGMQAISDYASGTGRNVEELNQKFGLITRSSQSYQSIADQFSGILPATSKDFLKQAQAAGFLSKKYTELTKVPIAEYQEAVAKMLEKGVDDLNLTGNTASETAETLTGSLAGFQKALSNLVTGFADKNADLSKLIGDMVTTTKNLIRNWAPAFGEAFKGFGEAVKEIAPVLAEELPGLVEEVLPSLLDAVKSLIGSAATALPGIISTIGSVGLSFLTSIVSDIADNVDTVIPQLTEGLSGLATKIGEVANGDSVDLAQAGLDLLSKLANAMVKAVPDVLSTLTEMFTSFTGKIEEAAKAEENPLSITNTAKLILTNLAEHLSTSVGEVLPELTSAMASFISTFAGEASNATVNVTNAATNIIKKIVDGIAPAIPQVMTDITSAAMSIIDAIVNYITTVDSTSFLSAAVTVVTSLADGIVQSVDKITAKLPELITQLVAWLTDTNNLKNMAEAAITIFGELVSDIPAIITSLATGLGSIIEGIVNYFKEHGDEMSGGLKDGLSGAESKLKEAWSEKIEPAFETMVSDIKKKFSEFEWVATVEAWFNNLNTSIETKWTDVTTTISSKVEEIKTSFNDLIASAITWGSDMITNFVNGITSKWEELKQKVIDIANTVKSFLGFSEPEEGPLSDFHTYAPDMMELFAKGIRDNKKMLADTVADAFDFSNVISTKSISAAGSASGTNYGGFTINVYGAQGMDEETLARLVANRVRDEVVSIGAMA